MNERDDDQQAELKLLRARVAAICDRLFIDPYSPIDPVVSGVISHRDQLEHDNRQLQAKIGQLKKVLGAYEKLVTAYRCGGRTPERALDIIGNYKAAKAAEEK